jgi:hypothetical protein
MLKPVLGLTLSALATLSTAAPDPHCSEHERLRSQRDSALQKKDLKQYCNALSGLIRLMPAKPPGKQQLKCEFTASTMSAQTWLGIRPNVVSTMKTTFDQQCR